MKNVLHKQRLRRNWDIIAVEIEGRVVVRIFK